MKTFNKPRGKQLLPTAPEQRQLLREAGERAENGCNLSRATLLLVNSLQSVIIELQRLSIEKERG